MPRAAGTLQKTLFRKGLPKTRKTPRRSSSQNNVALQQNCWQTVAQPKDSDGTNEGDRRLVMKDRGHHIFIYLICMLITNSGVKKKRKDKSTQSIAELNYFFFVLPHCEFEVETVTLEK